MAHTGQTWHSALCRCRIILTPCVYWQVLRLLIKLYESVDNPDWASICQCLMFLDDAAEVAKILARLLKGSQVRLPALATTEDCVAALLGECKSCRSCSPALAGCRELHLVTMQKQALIKYGRQEDALLAYQVSFDLFENEQQAFSLQVCPLSRRASSWRVCLITHCLQA